MSTLEKVIEQFRNEGYHVSNISLPKKLLWQPDVILSKGSQIYFILFKNNNSIPQSFLSRISYTPKENIVPVIVFGQKAKREDENSILSFGIGLAYFIRGKLAHVNIKKKLPRKKIRKEIKKKLPVIDIFISSKQEIPERTFVAGRVEF